MLLYGVFGCCAERDWARMVVRGRKLRKENIPIMSRRAGARSGGLCVSHEGKRCEAVVMWLNE
jgi:hypothetical protein